MNWDTQLFYAINGLAERSTFMDWMMLAVGLPATFLLPGALALSYWLWRSRREALVGVAAVAALIIAVDQFGAQIKHLVARVRPCHALAGIHQLTGCGGTFSFPSNHALNTAAAAAFAQVLYPRTRWIAWPIVAVAGFSRVYVGAHYVTDVLGAWIIGGSLGALAGMLLVKSRYFRLGNDSSSAIPVSRPGD